jgi:NhaA family Na+:H+ antiporter
VAIIVIAVFYTEELSDVALMLAGIGIAALAALNLLNIRNVAAYVLVGVFTWVCVLKSGVHATLAGVAVGLAIPLARYDGESLLERVEHSLKPWVSYGVVPIFAFANAGVPLAGVSLSSLTAAVPLGIVGGLFLGKQLGVFGATIAAIRLGIAELPVETSVAQLYGIAILTGIGFTMSLFIGTLAFDDESVLAQIRLGVLAASILSGIVAAGVLLMARSSRTA